MPIGIMGIVLVAAAALGAGALISTYILPPQEHNVYVETGPGDIETGGTPIAGFMDMLPWIIVGLIALVIVYWFFIKRKK